MNTATTTTTTTTTTTSSTEFQRRARAWLGFTLERWGEVKHEMAYLEYEERQGRGEHAGYRSRRGLVRWDIRPTSASIEVWEMGLAHLPMGSRQHDPDVLVARIEISDSGRDIRMTRHEEPPTERGRHLAGKAIARIMSAMGHLAVELPESPTLEDDQ